MIRVTPQPEPDSFNLKVREKGLAWLKSQNITLDHPIPSGTNLQPYWKKCLPEMRKAYQGFCAYTNVLINPGEGTIDHFQPKSKYPHKAYEWDNYRLAVSKVNSYKRDFEDVLDPFYIQNEWFQLNPVTGAIYANPTLCESKRSAINKTIQRLRLNESAYKDYRTAYIKDYIDKKTSVQFLKRDAPFIYAEMERQQLL